MSVRRPLALEALEDRTVPAGFDPANAEPRYAHDHVHHVAVDLPQVGPNPSLVVGPSDDPETHYVQQLYFDLLGRTIDPGAQPFIDDLSNARMSRKDVAEQILHSDEYAARRIESMYRAFLGRSADEQSLNAFVAQVQGGGSFEEIATFLLSSEEYRGMHRDAESHVRALYDDVLGRTPDRDSLEKFIARHDAGDGAQIVHEIVASVEARKMGGEAAVELMLNRKPSADFAAGFVAAARDGAAVDAVLADLAASEAYFNLKEIR